MEKTELRQSGIATLKKLAEQPKKKAKKEEMILALFFASWIWKEANVIGMIRSTPFEFNTEPIMQRAWAENKRVVVPKSLPKRQLAFYEVDPRTAYRTTKFGVDEPVSALHVSKEEIDVLLVPGIIFSKDGYRIGFGGGFYDRYLAEYKGRTCSLVFSEQLNNDWQPDSFDLPVARIFTDTFKGVTYE
ncbi:5-formyltetrahydrofolate cyclo-ligase [Enterococcus saccharolyticus]|uniref:5-formyltetrahydrofolate cyclo-ligase n=1 Tax=Enterococcus saccharolyticus TaxID=41997 RepID=UPI0039E18393